MPADTDLLHAARLVLGAYYGDPDNLALKMLDLGQAVHDIDEERRKPSPPGSFRNALGVLKLPKDKTSEQLIREVRDGGGEA